MGTTKDALAAGSTSVVFVVAIEGFSKLITDGPTAAVVTAWAGTDWTQAIGGLYRDMTHEQRFDPWNPIQGGGAHTISVVPDSTEALAIEMARTDTHPDTEITANVDRNANTIHVKYASQFTASGEAFLGNECFSYLSRTATAFTVGQRGKYSPFGSGGSDATHFAGEHRISAFDQYTTNVPIVTQYRRDFRGAWVGVWAHRVVAGVLDTRAQAQCVFAGQIDEYGQDASDITVIHLTHVLDLVANRSLGNDQFTCRAAPGYYVGGNSTVSGAAAALIKGYDTDASGTHASQPLLIMASGASGANQINAGYYSVAELVDRINAWFDSERAAGRITGFHALSIQGSGDQAHIVMSTRFSAATTVQVSWFFFTEDSQTEAAFGVVSVNGGIASSSGNPLYGSGIGSTDYAAVARYPIQPQGLNGVFGTGPNRFEIDQLVGTFVDQSAFMPPQFASYIDNTQPNGVFLADNKQLLIGYVTGTEFIGRVVPDPKDPTAPVVLATPTFQVTQILVLSTSFYDLQQYLFHSTGTAGYNSLSSYDALTSGYSMNIPGALMPPAQFDATLGALPGFDLQETVWIMKPTRFVDLFKGDMVLRGAHLVFRNGGLEWSVWSTPIVQNATVFLSESNKAEPAGSPNRQAAVMLKSAEFAKPILNIYYDWDALSNTFKPPLPVVDQVGVDIQGGGLEPAKIECRNFGTGQAARDALTLLLTGTAGGDIGFMAKWIPFCSRPLSTMTRSIAQILFENVCPGDTVAISDTQARDPATGLRGLTFLPGMVLQHSFDYGGYAGPDSEEPTPQSGSASLMVMAVNRSTIWSPAADVDETVSGAGFTVGYNSATLQLQCKAHSYSEASEAVDAASYNVGDAILITDIDPPTPSAPTQWARFVTNVVGSTITIDSALATPAFNAALKYRITSQLWNLSTPSQEGDAYQADTTAGVITGGDAPAFQWGLAGINTTTPTAPSHTDLCEYIATTSYDDGAPLDVGNHKSIIRTINNLIDHRTAHQSPSLGKTALSASGSTTQFRLVYQVKRFFGQGRYGAGYPVSRKAWVSLFMRSNKATTATARVTFSRNRITSPYTLEASGTIAGYHWPSSLISQATFTAPNTTWITTPEQALDLSMLDTDGCCWVSIEHDSSAQSLGLAQIIERERT